jgi:hypothetical protein
VVVQMGFAILFTGTHLVLWKEFLKGRTEENIKWNI